MKVSTKINSEHYNWGEGCDGWHLVKSPQLSVIQERVPVGLCEVTHYHEKAEQFFFVLSGVATLIVEGKAHSLNPTEGFHVKANTTHQLKNDGDQELVFIVTSTPPSHGDRVEARA
ncbi:cupin domain-containing protein [Shewanella sp. ULN5]|uniref:cupin domain-containing protein n=1 Tax=Shewanella sp. ULN5 TaxID=2994678 RepID=UPI00273EAE70|nr:cupin domain-containing protein [Shewanella sp. ULN5]MDP5147516.1 cupin domain-containing protein [Shewanella sp. ULN5]